MHSIQFAHVRVPANQMMVPPPLPLRAARPQQAAALQSGSPPTGLARKRCALVSHDPPHVALPLPLPLP
jgi:hypothetical protein